MIGRGLRPAGRSSPTRNPDHAAKRELLEETGLALACERVSVDGGPTFVYAAVAPIDVKITLADEHDRYEWVSTEEAACRCRPLWVGALFGRVP